MPSADIIVPVFKAQDVLPLFQARIHAVMFNESKQRPIYLVDEYQKPERKPLSFDDINFSE